MIASVPLSTRLRDAGRAMRGILRNPALRRIELAFLGFNMIEYGTWIAILVYANDATGPASVGLVAVAQLVPSGAFAPIAASLGDRFPRLRVLLGGYLFMAASLAATAAAIAGDADPIVVYAAAVVLAASITVPRPVQAALTPAFAETPEELTATNGVNTIFENVGTLAGPLAAGVLLAVGSPALVFAAAGVVAGACAWLIGRLGRHLPATAALVSPTTDEALALAPGRVGGILGGIRAVAGDRTQGLLVVLLGSRYVVVGALDVLIVLMATDALALGGAAAGYFGAAIGLGGLVGGVLTLVVVGRRGLAAWMVLGALAAGAGLGLVATGTSFETIVVLLAAIGIGLAGLDVAGRTMLQRIGDAEMLTRVFGVVEALAMFGLAIGSLAAAVLYEALGIVGATVAIATVLPIVAVVAWAPLARADAALDVPLAQIRLLRGLPMFSLLPAPALERAARQLVAFAVPARAIVFREGDPGDRFYLIEEGAIEITQAGSSVRALGPGGSFGEIALLRDVPRTATASAATDAHLWALDRDAFLLAITGSPGAVAEARARTAGLLAADEARHAPA